MFTKKKKKNQIVQSHSDCEKTANQGECIAGVMYLESVLGCVLWIPLMPSIPFS